jgi:hypothetical protein
MHASQKVWPLDSHPLSIARLKSQRTLLARLRAWCKTPK